MFPILPATIVALELTKIAIEGLRAARHRGEYTEEEKAAIRNLAAQNQLLMDELTPIPVQGG